MSHVPAPGRVLVIQQRRLGDVILSTGLLGDLRRAFPDALLDFLVGRPAAPLLEHHPDLDERIVLDEEHSHRQAWGLRERGYDWVIDVQSSPRTAQMTRITGAPVRAGWDIGFWALAYTHKMPRRGRATEYVLRERQRFLELLGVPITTPARPRLYLSAAERAAGEAALREAGVHGGAPIVGLLLTTSERSRDWKPERFAELARTLIAQGIAPVVLRAPGDAEAAQRFSAHAPAVPHVHRVPLREFLGVIAGCALLVSGDTGPAHMAVALDVPTVTIYGPTDPAAWNPGLPTTVALRVGHSGNVAARERRQQMDRDYTAGVTPTMVLGKVHALLARAVPGDDPNI